MTPPLTVEPEHALLRKVADLQAQLVDQVELIESLRHALQAAEGKVTRLQSENHELQGQVKHQEELTNALSAKVEELETFMDVAVERELKLIELRKEVERLNAKLHPATA